jgi:hexokinase
MRIVNMKSFKIDEKVRQRRGAEFFEWMAEKIETALAESPPQNIVNMDSFPMGLAWSFPIEYVQLFHCKLLC